MTLPFFHRPDLRLRVSTHDKYVTRRDRRDPITSRSGPTFGPGRGPDKEDPTEVGSEGKRGREWHSETGTQTGRQRPKGGQDGVLLPETLVGRGLPPCGGRDGTVRSRSWYDAGDTPLVFQGLGTT